MHVSLRLKERIWAGQFVELALLLPGNAPVDDDNGEQKKQKDTKLPALSVSQFDSAFRILIALRAERHPQDAPGMLKHLETVHELTKMFGAEAGLFYDRNVRLAQHHNPTLLWGHLNMEVYMQATALGLKTASQSRPSQQSKPYGQKWLKPDTCWFFQTKGYCVNKRCKYTETHRCYTCQGPHATIKCPSKDQLPPQPFRAKGAGRPLRSPQQSANRNNKN